LSEYLLKNGHEQVIREYRDAIMTIKTLGDFQYFDEESRQDCGLNGKRRKKREKRQERNNEE
jgi:hypothetical protein